MSKDLFSAHSKQYAAFRPTYPPELYDFILKHVKSNNTAWDCATGNGQVAKDLSERFDKVYATDHSANQVENAFRKDNIIYSVQPAEKTSFADRQFDLITAGQALHWFNIPAFFDEARRVSKPAGIVAVWGYSLLSVEPGIDPLINHFYTGVIGPYWDKERKLIDDQYRGIPFPFEKITVPTFQFSFNWTLGELRGYLSTWSSVQKFIRQNQSNPVDALVGELAPLWKTHRKKVSFPLFVLIGRV
jgi:ubiquinone/menaquinone biosynthesis C-methylase UbiE